MAGSNHFRRLVIAACIGMVGLGARAEGDYSEEQYAEEEYTADEHAEGDYSEEQSAKSEGNGSASAQDLDAYDDATLLAELEDELDDIYANHQIDPDSEYDIADLRAWFLECLMNDDDDNPEVSYANLQEELNEAGTTLEEAIDEGLAQADLQSSNWRAPTAPGDVRSDTYGLTSGERSTLGFEFARRNGSANSRIAVRAVTNELFTASRRRNTSRR